jgi:hypothetical protein
MLKALRILIYNKDTPKKTSLIRNLIKKIIQKYKL